MRVNKIFKIYAILIILPVIIYSNLLLPKNIEKNLHQIDDEVLINFSKLVIQDSSGRMKPIDTISREIIYKITGKSSIGKVSAIRLFIGMTVQPNIYQNIPLIKISHNKIIKNLKLKKDTKYAKFKDFFTKDNLYKLKNEISIANRTDPKNRDKYFKELIKVDERLNVLYMVFLGDFLTIYPFPNNKNNSWLSPKNAINNFLEKDSKIITIMTQYLFGSLEFSIANNKDWDKVINAIDFVSTFQQKSGDNIIPSSKTISFEIFYNKINIFSKLVPIYLILGFILLIFSIINIVKSNFYIKKIVNIVFYLTCLALILHIIGILIRWYIGGHAPWSNAYESIVFIAFTTVVAGLLFSKKSSLALSATLILSGVTMAVAHLSFMNPEITNLVPVLKSYWLMIHVATIISADGFLGLGSMISLFIIILIIFQKDNIRINHLTKELSVIVELSLIIGLFLLIIGNFLGGIWANESWGRYWGWDAKETWAAVTILIYATVLHLRFVPKMKSILIFNLSSLWAYSSVLMTYFGVNYYLSGLHSYAAGDPIPIPNWVYYTVFIIFLISLLAIYQNKIKNCSSKKS